MGPKGTRVIRLVALGILLACAAAVGLSVWLRPSLPPINIPRLGVHVPTELTPEEERALREIADRLRKELDAQDASPIRPKN